MSSDAIRVAMPGRTFASRKMKYAISTLLSEAAIEPLTYAHIVYMQIANTKVAHTQSKSRIQMADSELHDASY